MASCVASSLVQRTLVHRGRALHTLSHNLVVCQADRQQGSSPGAPASPAATRVPPPAPGAPGGRPPAMPPMLNENGEVVQFKKLNEGSGVVAMDSGEEPDNVGRIALLAAGDAAALLLFATIGRLSHGEPLDVGAILGTAAPFMAGWYASAAAVGAYGKAAQGGDAGKAALAAAKAWGLGIPAGLVLRSIARGYVPETTFVLVSMAATGVFLVGWRTALAAATPVAPEPRTPREQLAARRDRKGGAWEFIEMIMSMTKRW